MFTDRFVKLPIQVYNKKEVELYGKEPVYENSWLKISPFEICYYKPGEDDEGANAIYLLMKNGTGFFVYMTVDDFEKLLNSIT